MRNEDFFGHKRNDVGTSVYLIQKTFQLFAFLTLWQWEYIVKVIPYTYIFIKTDMRYYSEIRILM